MSKLRKLKQWASAILSFHTYSSAAKHTVNAVRPWIAAPPAEPAEDFPAVFEKEIEQVQARRAVHKVTFHDPRRDLVGLALSGGGIRSATFCLGFLQALDDLKLLRLFDYLSTVSGGGFVGAWWTAWLSRPFVIQDVVDARGLATALAADLPVSKSLLRSLEAVRRSGGQDDAEVEALRLEVVNELNRLACSPPTLRERVQAVKARRAKSPAPEHLDARGLEAKYARFLRPRSLFPPTEELEASCVVGYVNPQLKEAALTAGRDLVHHVRLFSNYLTPRKGLLSGDTWLAIAVISRNLLLTWLVLVPALMTVTLLCQLYFVAQPFDDRVVAEFTEYALPLPADQPVDTDHPSLRARAWVALRPVAVLGGLMAFMTVLWMGYNNAGSLVTRRAAFAMVLVVLYVTVWKPLVGSSIGAVSHRYGLALVLGLALALWWWVWSVPPSTTAGAGPRRQVRANRATQCHAALLVSLVVMASMLFFTGFAEPLFTRIASRIPGDGATVKTVGGVTVGVLTALATLFTALKASPAGGRDARELVRPSLVSQAIFAATPPLVLIVLSVVAAGISRYLLSAFSNDGSIVGLSVAAFCGIGLCMLFASYELVDGRSRPGGAASSFHWVRPLALLLGTVVVFHLAFGSRLDDLWRRTQVLDLVSMSWWYGLMVACGGAVLVHTLPLRRNRGRVLFLGITAVQISRDRCPGQAIVGAFGQTRSGVPMRFPVAAVPITQGPTRPGWR